MAEIRLFEDRDRAQAADLWQECFGDSDGFCRWFMREQWNGEYSVAAFEGERPVSMIHGRPYTLSIRGRETPAVIMCGVATAPEYRHRGLMRRCMELFERNAREKGANVLFQSPVDFKIYEWCMQYPSSASAIITSKKAQGTRGCRYAEDSPCCEGFAEELLIVYDRIMEGYSGQVVRSAEDMRSVLRGHAADGGRLVRYIKEGRTRGYALYFDYEGQISSIEFMAEGRAAAGMVSFLGAKGRGKKLSLRGPAGLGAVRLPACFKADWADTTAMAALNVPALLRGLAGFNDVTVEVEDSVIPENNGVFAFDGERTSAPADIKLDSGRLMQLLSGYMDIIQLEGDGRVRVLSRRAADMLAERLPALPCFTAEEY